MDLTVSVGALRLKNPLILSSAGYTANANGIQRFIGKGFGAVVCKTVTREPREGAPSPRIFWYDPDKKTMLSGAEGLRNPGVEKMSQAIASSRALADEHNCRIVGSVTGSSLEEMADNAARLCAAGADAIEIDMACPSTGPHLGPEYAQLGKYWAQDANHAVAAIRAVKEATNVPVWVKAPLGCLLSAEFVKAVDKDARPDAYSFVGGRMPCLVINTDTGEPLLPGNIRLMIEKKIPVCPMVTGPVRPTTIYHTAYISHLTKTPLIPTGGLSCGDDIIQAIMAGASAAGICAAVYRDQNAPMRILSEIEDYVSRKKLGSLDEIKGAVLQHLPAPPLLKVQTVW